MAEASKMKMKEKLMLFIAKNIMTVSIAVLVGFLLFGYLLLFSPELKKIKQANVSQSLESERVAKENYVASLEKVAAQYAELDQEKIANLTRMIPEEREIPALLAMLEASAGNSDISLISINFSEAELDGVVADVKGLKALNVNLGLANASYTRFKLFLESLETNLRLFDIRSLSMDPAAATYAVSIRTYMRDTGKKK